MQLRIDTHSGEPIWRQLVEQVKYHVAAGDLLPGDQLPSIRSLAQTLKVNPRTVVKAYDELEHGGLIVTRQGQGAFVTNGPLATPMSRRKPVLLEMTRRLFAEAARLGADANEVRGIVDEVARDMERPK